MCACRLEANSASSTPQASPSGELGFEDYYPYLMEEGGGDGTNDRAELDDGDVYSQLAQKERDLILAAELGKALLEKNQELSKRNEGLAEEYSQKIEELTQEKHELRIRLENVEAEYETTVKDLQHEITALRHELEEQQMTSRQGDRTRSQIVHELNQQNERLAEQLRKSGANEEALQNQVDGMRQQIMCRRNSMHEHVHQLGVLREELRKREHEMRELQDTNHRLHERIEEMSLLSSHSFLDQSTTSLLSELEMSGLGDGLGLPLQNGNKDSLNSTGSSPLKQEVLEAYKAIKRMLRDLRGSDSSQGNSPEDFEVQEFKAGSLVQVLEELKALMYDLCRLQSQRQDGGGEGGAVGGMMARENHLAQMEVKVESLQHELKMTQEELSRLRANLSLKDQQLEAKTEELTDLTNKLSMRHDELMALQADRDRILDDAAGITPDDILTQCRSDRDCAIEKRNSMEVELARAKQDLMNLDCQLLEAIQQKVQLSQQLEQWEDDVHQLIDVRVQHIHEKEKESKSPARSQQGTPVAARRRLPFPWS